MPAGASRYLDIAADLRTRILSGEWEPGAKLPRMTDLARHYEVNRDTLARAVAILEADGMVWAVPRRGTIVRQGMSRPRRLRGNLVKRNVATEGPGYSFPSASGQEVWKHHITPTARHEKLTDPRLALMLGVPEGTEVMRRLRVRRRPSRPSRSTAAGSTPAASKTHPRSRTRNPDPGGWLHRLEAAGHGPISWIEYHRARMPSKDEADLLQIPVTLPVLIVRVGRSAKVKHPSR